MALEASYRVNMRYSIHAIGNSALIVVVVRRSALLAAVAVAEESMPGQAGSEEPSVRARVTAIEGSRWPDVEQCHPNFQR
jgi:hypothetical protein